MSEQVPVLGYTLSREDVPSRDDVIEFYNAIVAYNTEQVGDHWTGRLNFFVRSVGQDRRRDLWLHRSRLAAHRSVAGEGWLAAAGDGHAPAGRRRVRGLRASLPRC